MMKRINILILVLSPLVFCSASCSKLADEHEEAMNLPIEVIDFTQLQEGVYTGYYYGGMYAWRENSCEVEISSRQVARIQLLSSAAEYTPEFLDTLYQRVISRQSLQVDAVSGSTLDSRACLKSVENALLKAKSPEQ